MVNKLCYILRLLQILKMSRPYWYVIVKYHYGTHVVVVTLGDQQISREDHHFTLHLQDSESRIRSALHVHELAFASDNQPKFKTRYPAMDKLRKTDWSAWVVVAPFIALVVLMLVGLLWG